MNTVSVFQTTPRIVMGPGTINGLGDEAGRLGASKVMIVTDPGLVSAGLAGRLQGLLRDAGLAYEVFDQVEPDPRYEIAVAAAEAVKRFGADLMIALGGGSPIDICKVAAILAANDGPVDGYFGIDLVPNPGVKTILIPTTAGTGSEVTPIAILSDEGEKLKKGIVSSYLFPALAILDPELTTGLPPAVTAATGMDALIHAVEAFTSKKANTITDMFALKAIKLINANIRTAYANGEDLAARGNMMLGSLLAGMAFANAGVTAVHAFAYPIGAEFHIPHGVANSIMLAPVMEFNMIGNLAKFAAMADAFGENTEGLNLREAALLAVEAMKTLAKDLNVPSHLSDFGVEEKDIPALAEGVMKVTRLLANNPRLLSQKDAEAIYLSVL